MSRVKKLRVHYLALGEHKKALDQIASRGETALGQAHMQTIMRDLESLKQEFPELVPLFTVEQLHRKNRVGFDTEAVRGFLGSVLARVQAEMEEVVEPPGLTGKSFPFVFSDDLRRIVERDYEEMQRAFVTKCWKSVIILAGGAIEGVLLDLLTQHENRAKRATAAPKSVGDLSRWSLADLINVSVEINLVGENVEKLSHPVREFRNLVHPGREVREGLTFGAEEARIAAEVLSLLHRELS